MEQNAPIAVMTPFDAGATQYLLETTRDTARRLETTRDTARRKFFTAAIAVTLAVAIIICPYLHLEHADASSTNEISPKLEQVISRASVEAQTANIRRLTFVGLI
jgi:hypothetical protein